MIVSAPGEGALKTLVMRVHHTECDAAIMDIVSNMKQNALFYQETCRDLKVKCGNAWDYYKEICLDECATCRRYQGCHVMSEEQCMDLPDIVMLHQCADPCRVQCSMRTARKGCVKRELLGGIRGALRSLTAMIHLNWRSGWCVRLQRGD